MMTRTCFRPLFLISLALLAGCPIPTETAPSLIACWDLNQNGVAEADEDVNGDGAVDVLDCRGLTGPAGPQGPAGSDGADASELLYGDGSSGARTVTSDARFETAADANQQWTDFVVAAGATLRIQSGAVIRCSGEFTNHGMIIIESGAQGGDRAQFDPSTLEGATQPAALGINTLAAAGGEVGGAAAARAGGAGGDGISEFETRVTLRIGVRAGSGGGAALGAGGAGGGGVTIFSRGPLQNLGSIVADGADAPDGGGGGGGGVLLLASAQSITNHATASLLARGGSGGPATSASGPGGGGGGGVIHAIAPSVQNLGAWAVDGGSAGSLSDQTRVTALTRAGGAGGGGSGGAGGAGGSVPAGDSAAPGAAGDGAPGHILITMKRPDLLFR